MKILTSNTKIEYNHGFTLIELAIVLVIIGFGISGILVGGELLDINKEKRLLRDLKTLQASFIMFKDKYKDFPGDTDKAYGFWGASCGSSLANCNGNGDDNIGESESLKLFRHLYLAGLGNFESNTDSTSVAQVNGNVMPSTYSDNSGYLIMKNSFDGSVGSRINIRFATNGASTSPGNFMGAIMTGLEAKEFDTKYDDGIPWEGEFNFRRGSGLSGSICTNFTRPGTWYEDTGISCFFYFRIEEYENQLL